MSTYSELPGAMARAYIETKTRDEAIRAVLHRFPAADRALLADLWHAIDTYADLAPEPQPAAKE